MHGGKVCDAASGEAEECNVQPCSDEWTAAIGADIAPDGVTFSSEAANAVVTSQKGVEAISVLNAAVSGSVHIGLAQDANPNFDSGKGIVLPYKGHGAKADDLITIASQGGHAKVFLNNEPESVEDLGKVGNILMAKVILDQDSSVRVTDIVISGPSSSSALLEEVAAVPEQTEPSWMLSAAMAAASVSMMAAVACHRSRPAVGVQQPLLQQ